MLTEEYSIKFPNFAMVVKTATLPKELAILVDVLQKVVLSPTAIEINGAINYYNN